ncbi:hypothetical protein FDZ74_15200 [bacterium]|nr:MAG: hypothetical protein FDZ74_15200 [bacterium]
MDLNHLEDLSTLDPEHMLAEIDALPEQLESAWHLGLKQPLPQMSEVNLIIVAGMGGSAIGADLLAGVEGGKVTDDRDLVVAKIEDGNGKGFAAVNFADDRAGVFDRIAGSGKFKWVGWGCK